MINNVIANNESWRNSTRLWHAT